VFAVLTKRRIGLKVFPRHGERFSSGPFSTLLTTVLYLSRHSCLHLLSRRPTVPDRRGGSTQRPQAPPHSRPQQWSCPSKKSQPSKFPQRPRPPKAAAFGKLTENSYGVAGALRSERSWGTVRKDYSPNGAAWDFLSHDAARSKAYRWGEDGMAAICDRYQLLCFSLALWNRKDPILKERIFGLTPPARAITAKTRRSTTSTSTARPRTPT